MLALHFHSGQALQLRSGQALQLRSGQALYLGKMLIDFIMQGLRGAAGGNSKIGAPRGIDNLSRRINDNPPQVFINPIVHR
jgi:hypothetical protein